MVNEFLKWGYLSRRYVLLDDIFANLGATMRSAMFAVAAALIVGSCASNIMKSYVGKTVADVILDYGPPATAFDVDGNRRAFVWTIRQGYVIPGNTFSTGNINVVGNTALYSGNTISTPAVAGVSECNYALFAQRRAGAPDGPAAWQVVDYKAPRLSCE